MRHLRILYILQNYEICRSIWQKTTKEWIFFTKINIYKSGRLKSIVCPLYCARLFVLWLRRRYSRSCSITLRKRQADYGNKKKSKHFFCIALDFSYLWLCRRYCVSAIKRKASISFVLRSTFRTFATKFVKNEEDIIRLGFAHSLWTIVPCTATDRPAGPWAGGDTDGFHLGQ